jgi:recombination protein RecR
MLKFTILGARILDNSTTPKTTNLNRLEGKLTLSNNAVPPAVTDLIEAFSRLPGVGNKTASRLTYYLLRVPENVSLSLAEALQNLKANTIHCEVCFNIAETSPCPICSDPQRDRSTIAIVEEPLDVMAIERTSTYRGLYHVLLGAISPVNGVGPDDLKIAELTKRVEASDTTLEVIIATNPNMEGEATAMFIKRQLAGSGVKVTRLARGLPSGGDLEYVDEVTLKRAIEGRDEM